MIMVHKISNFNFSQIATSRVYADGRCPGKHDRATITTYTKVEVPPPLTAQRLESTPAQIIYTRGFAGYCIRLDDLEPEDQLENGGGKPEYYLSYRL